MNSNYLSCANKSAHPPPPVTDKMVSLPYWWLKKKRKKQLQVLPAWKKKTLKKEGGKTCCEARGVFPVVSSTARGEQDHRTWRGGGAGKIRRYQEASPYPSHRYLLHTTRHTVVTLGRWECGDSSSECHGKRLAEGPDPSSDRGILWFLSVTG